VRLVHRPHFSTAQRDAIHRLLSNGIIRMECLVHDQTGLGLESLATETALRHGGHFCFLCYGGRYGIGIGKPRDEAVIPLCHLGYAQI
jgi:hypothetical protein